MEPGQVTRVSTRNKRKTYTEQHQTYITHFRIVKAFKKPGDASTHWNYMIQVGTEKQVYKDTELEDRCDPEVFHRKVRDFWKKHVPELPNKTSCKWNMVNGIIFGLSTNLGNVVPIKNKFQCEIKEGIAWSLIRTWNLSKADVEEMFFNADCAIHSMQQEGDSLPLTLDIGRCLEVLSEKNTNWIAGYLAAIKKINSKDASNCYVVYENVD